MNLRDASAFLEKLDLYEELEMEGYTDTGRAVLKKYLDFEDTADGETGYLMTLETSTGSGYKPLENKYFGTRAQLIDVVLFANAFVPLADWKEPIDQTRHPASVPQVDRWQGTDGAEDFGYVGIDGKGGYFFNYKKTLEGTLDTIEEDEEDRPSFPIEEARDALRADLKGDFGFVERGEAEWLSDHSGTCDIT